MITEYGKTKRKFTDSDVISEMCNHMLKFHICMFDRRVRNNSEKDLKELTDEYNKRYVWPVKRRKKYGN